MATKRGPGRLRLRVIFDPDVVLGPGKADLLDGIRDTGSISAAGRRMKMSYKRAWDLVDAMNRFFREPVVHTSKGGSGGGGATLTPFGEQVLAAYRRIEARSAEAVADELAWLHARLRPPQDE
ncbi:LysR family transcriptional regulator [Luteimonas sp. BDR2-5]|uniref:winged helix-turn-helix domain-containing protein n=1 Tax=Proluteimonas luteida TaxID=2878685 RepID=UPI001E48166C|nr:LysR family transcriptional regulator [Luteimonas sp. BDR2-5]MCD9027477.1 LysR family transcriptional regulator [Luteimonas sp. BDR2-5]